MGLRPPVQFYGHRIEKFHLPKDGDVEYAFWAAPGNKPSSPSQSEIDDLRKFIREGDFAIDIGAYTGDSTMPIALACGGTGAVLAFEPNPITAAVLTATAALNPAKARIIPVPYAAAGEEGAMTFHYANPWFTNGGDRSKLPLWHRGAAFAMPVYGVEVERFVRDRHADRLPRLRYIKVDAEGNDLSVLQSIEGLLREFRPYVKAEIIKHSSSTYRVDIHRFLTKLNYKVRLVETDTLFGRPIEETEMESKKTFDIFATPEP